MYNFFKDLLEINHPEMKITILNKGISGNTIIDLKERWEDESSFITLINFLY